MTGEHLCSLWIAAGPQEVALKLVKRTFVIAQENIKHFYSIRLFGTPWELINDSVALSLNAMKCEFEFNVSCWRVSAVALKCCKWTCAKDASVCVLHFIHTYLHVNQCVWQMRRIKSKIQFQWRTQKGVTACGRVVELNAAYFKIAHL